jgi:hypothetical protein
MRVFIEEMYFHFIGEVFLYNFFSLSLTAHAHQLINLNVQGSYTSIIISALDQFQLVPSGGDTGPHS